MPATTAPSIEKTPKSSVFGISVEAEEQVRAVVDEEDLHDHAACRGTTQDVDAREDPQHAQSRDIRMSAATRPSSTPRTWATTAM